MHNEIHNLHATSSHSTLLTPLIMFNRLDFAYASLTDNKIRHNKFAWLISDITYQMPHFKNSIRLAISKPASTSLCYVKYA
ncbi:hypothetical protein T03_9536 [Trichinella britovi]|uniref:Uncharacterized protein n=1 Tax=Trichinella britovi TaxID=45882 RepID=A0A0V1DDC7_TRIBR|nr:hypothetical protein T03_9536 [Trichinella britovi]